MLNGIFQSQLSTTTESFLTFKDFFLCLAVALFIGFLLALVYQKIGKSSQSFVSTLAILPAIVCVVIMLVNGSVGAGVAVAGAFSLVRFRSAPGTAKEIGAIFIAMAAGLATGMGYIAFAILFTIVLCGAEFVYSSKAIGKLGAGVGEKVLRITIPEDLDYGEIFDDLFRKFLVSSQLIEVKTTNLGSLFRLTYQVSVRKDVSEKKMMDAIRCRNGNLEVSLSRPISNHYEL